MWDRESARDSLMHVLLSFWVEKVYLMNPI
jgi:hypothetical protein